MWRANVLGASGKGHEYFLKHLLGSENAVFKKESEKRPDEIRWRDKAPEGKLDLLVTLELRMSTSALYSDVILPAAGWYEMHDISTTDLHSFVHPFNPAIDPPWEARSNWDQFKAIAEAFSRLAETHLGKQKDLVLTPLRHDTPGGACPARSARLEERSRRSDPGKNHAELFSGAPRLRKDLQNDDHARASCF